MKNRIYSAVVDPVGPFPMQARHLVWSLTELAGVAADDIVLHVVNADSDPHILSSLERLGVEVIPVDPFPGDKYCNKLQQLFPLGSRDFEDVVLLDCDVIVLEEPPPANGGVLAKPVDFGRPEIGTLAELFAEADLPLAPATADIDKTATVLGYVSGGVTVIGREPFDSLSREWHRWAGWCLERANKRMRIDRVSFAMAIASSQVRFTELDSRFDVPTHAPRPATFDCTPAALHYHRAVDSQQFLLPVQDLPRVNQAIAMVNQRMFRQRRTDFDNTAFWNARYTLNPGLGSGVGSRGDPLARKQQLLCKVVSMLNARSILDVGSGDGQTASALPQEISVNAIDLAASSRSFYLKAVPRASWSQHDITSAPPATDADLIVCLDVLIHLSNEQDYQLAIQNLLAPGLSVLISGFDAPPANFGPMTYFHEPMSTSIAAHGFAATPLDAYNETTVFIAMPPTANQDVPNPR
jgi:2-polyprenyl-3-methyl-5-hydroxy-6-metoxy-1,4-benzoquinol methylase